MGTNSPGTPKKCRLILQQCLAIQLTKPGSPPEDFWMYDSGYTIFQNFLSANLQCWWNAPLAAATKVLKYLGHIAPGMLLITAEPCALEIIRSAYARSVLKPPATYLISSVGDIDDCIVTPIVQTQFTPLTEALCDVIMELTSQGQSATIENIRNRLRSRFTHMQQPSVEVIYDTLVQLMQEIKIYQTSKGYFIVTPEKRRYKSNGTGLEYGFTGELNGSAGSNGAPGTGTKESKTLLMSSHEALSSLYGEISTERAGDQTHQCIQTNLADVICGGNPNDKILYARTSGSSSSSKLRSSSFPSNGKTLERRHSLRFFGSSKRLQRSASTRSLSKNYAQTIGKDGTVGTGNGTGPAPGAATMPQGGTGSTAVGGPVESSLDAAKKQASSQSLLSRIFRRSTRSKSKSKQIETYSAQFPPPEWFNSKTTHLHSVGTQTTDYLDFPIKSRLLNSTFYDSSDVSQRSLSLPRRRHHHRRNLSSESTFFISSRDCSPVRRGKSPASGSSYYCGSLPRSIHSTPGSSSYYKSSTRSSTKQLASADKLHNNGSNSSSNSQPKMEHHQHHGTSRSNTSRNPGPASGPSSIDSGKMTYATTTSGPSSFDSEKLSSTRTSTHSSLESHVSSSTITTAIQQQQQQQQQQSSSGGPGSPSGGSAGQQASPSRVSMEAKANGGTVTTVLTAVASTTKTNNNTTNNSSISNGYKRYETTFGYSSGAGSIGSVMRRSTPSTNATSPTTPPSTGGHRLSLTKPIDHLAALSESLLQFRLNGDSLNGTGASNRANDVTNLPPSDGPGARKTTKTTTTTAVIRTVPIQGPPQDHTTGLVSTASGQPEQNRYNKNSTMNNSKVMPPMPPAAGVPPVQPPNFFYKNVLKNIQHDSKNFCGDLAIEKTRYGEEGGLYELPPCNTNLRRSNSEIKKLNSNHDPPLKNHTDELAGGLLSSSPKYNGSSYHHQQQQQHLGGSVQAPQSTLQPSQLSGLIVMKKSLSVSSEPNLLANGGDKGRSQQITIMVKENAGGGGAGEDTGNEGDGPVGKRGGGASVIGLDRRFSFQSNRPTDEPPELLEEMYEFPSLSDLSFNFTSLAAQKILQGDASLNSIDTLVELNINQEKQQTLMRLKSDACLLAAKTAAANATATDEPLADTGGKVMTDFGMV